MPTKTTNAIDAAREQVKALPFDAPGLTVAEFEGMSIRDMDASLPAIHRTDAAKWFGGQYSGDTWRVYHVRGGERIPSADLLRAAAIIGELLEGSPLPGLRIETLAQSNAITRFIWAALDLAEDWPPGAIGKPTIHYRPNVMYARFASLRKTALTMLDIIEQANDSNENDTPPKWSEWMSQKDLAFVYDCSVPTARTRASQYHGGKKNKDGHGWRIDLAKARSDLGVINRYAERFLKQTPQS